MSATVFPKAAPGARTFLSGGIRFCGWAWIVFAVLNLADLAWRGRDMASVVAAAVMLLGCGIAYTVALRPRVVADDEAVRFHNLLRDVRLPWGAIDRFEGGDAVYAYVGEERHRAFVLQTSPRARARTELKARREDKKLPEAVAEYMRGRTATDFTVEQLRELAAERKKDEGTPGTVTSTWAWPAIMALVVPAALTVVTIIIASV
ncbi:PH domain-containing protein [Actinoallomurus sp. CA-142502]|uniref:PH domain-containing protein n=1 Tax=Actinoallomurus sp. CA-142502 TaxID=3239885 RepID=UPI003D8F7659